MHLTGNELAVASAGVAGVAVVIGWLNNRTTNLNALRLAREERSSRREDEASELKRTIYARCLAALNVLAMASIEFSGPRDEMRAVDVPNKDFQEVFNRARAECAAAELAAHNVGAEITW